MHKNGKGPPWVEHSYRAGIAAYLLLVRLCAVMVRMTLVLLPGYSYTAEAYARVGVLVDTPTEIYTADQTKPDAPYMLYYSTGFNGSKTGTQVDHPTCKTAEQLYEAASADARTLERAIFLSAFRREVEHALGRRMTDDELRRLADQAREEAHRWYKYIQADRRCAARWQASSAAPRLNPYAIKDVTDTRNFPGGAPGRSNDSGGTGGTGVSRGSASEQLIP